MKHFLVASILVSVLPSLTTSAIRTSFNDGIKKVTKPSLLEYAELQRPLVRTPSQGGSDGIVFDDLNELSYVVGIRSINLTYTTDRINSISVTYALSGGLTYTAPTRGKPSGELVSITLASQVSIYTIELSTIADSFVSQMTFLMWGPGNESIKYGPYGKPGDASFTYAKQVIAFYGSVGIYLNSIGLYGLELLKQSRMVGGEGGSRFDDGLLFQFPAIVGIRAISIWSGSIVDGIQVEYISLDSRSVLGGKHGEGGSNNKTEIKFAEGEQLEVMEGMTDSKLVTQLAFTSRRSNGSMMKYGPYGRSTKSSFNCTGSIIGFFGTAGEQIDGLGIFFVGNSTGCKVSP